MALSAALVDPRDVTEEVEWPVYRVYFWADSGSRSNEWRITGAADVQEVLDWAQRHESALPFAMYAEYEAGTAGRRGLLRLAGADPNASPHL
jgi:hypothetical protein